MKSSHIEDESRVVANLSRGTLLLVWQAVRLPISAFLVIVEPIVRLVLSSVALLSVLMAFVLEFSGAAPNFSFWTMLGFSVGCAVLLMAYYGLMRLFSK